MCVYNISEVEVLDQDLIVYKVVRPTSDFLLSFKSKWKPSERTIQESYGDGGTTLEYRLGEKTISGFDVSPGMYCYVEERIARRAVGLSSAEYVLEVRIPKGTKVKSATEIFLRGSIINAVILTEELISERVLA